MNAFAEILRSVGAGRLIGVSLVVLALIGLFVFVATQLGGGGNGNMALLYTELEIADSGRVVTRLEEMGVKYTLQDGGTRILAPADQIARLRLTMAEEGIVMGSVQGYEIFDKSDKLITNQFVQNINHLRALEGELSRTISGIAQIKSARVHLVLPKREIFSREEQEPSSSIVLSTVGGMRLERTQIAAIQHLVAAAVPRLQPSRISIIDNKGNLLAKGVNKDNEGSQTVVTAEEMRLSYQSRLRVQIESFLENIVGAGKVRAEVSVDLDLDRVTENSEIYDPDSQVVRSTQTVEESGSNVDKDQDPVTVGTQIPDPYNNNSSAEGKSSRSQNSRVEEVTNYEISKTIRQHVRETGVVRRLSVAVLVDGIYSDKADGTKNYIPRTEQEIAKLEAIVKSAVGFDVKRGDKVNVTNMQFVSFDDILKSKEQYPLGLGVSEIKDVIQVLIIAVVGILFLVLVVRPLMKRLILTIPTASSQAQLLTSQLAQVDDNSAISGVGGMPLLTQNGVVVEESDFDEMINIGRVKGKVRASSVSNVGKVIETNVDNSVSVIRNWIYEDMDI